ncbi:hypothetical protein LCGC14_2878210 [marine sediment metagenome]|uniref:Uncharacterized protein n=1 Tax=marine sediment metagenome TaxID=412755 RepID=A0A0F9AS23_9ZZZZ
MFKKTGKTTTIGVTDQPPKRANLPVDGDSKINPLNKDPNISIPRPQQDNDR